MAKKKRKVKRKKNKRIFGKLSKDFYIASGLTILAFIGTMSFLVQPIHIYHGIEETVELTPENFIKTLGPYAQEIYRETNLLPSISLAQAILESDWGKSDLAKQNHNLYGIKGTVHDPYFLTQEFTGTEYIMIKAPFRKYNHVKESMWDHAFLIKDGPSWNSNHYAEVIKADNYVDAAYALQEAGYATDPNYAKKVVNLIEELRLYAWDN